jgi:hypothetical protein
MDYILFDRHANMSSETLQQIGSLINKIEIDYDRNESFYLINMLYGLYDGYYYIDLPQLATNLLRNQHLEQVTNVLKHIDNYPKYLP